MAHAHPGARRTVRVVTLTISDSRSTEDDRSGEVLRAGLREHGFELVRHAIVPDEPARIREEITRALDGGEADAVVSTGGTGIAPRDQTYEAVTALLDKVLDGFGEAFRRLSWDEIGPRAILSRAVAGTYRGGIVVALPGSPNAVRLGVEKLLAPVLGHAVALVQRDPADAR
jgi:molybdenum cofactor biosynthesis protein B